MARKFYIKDEFIKRNKMYGFSYRRLSIYFLEKDGQPHLIDRLEYQTGSTPGARQMAFNHLVDKGYIPKKYGHKDMYESGAYKIYSIFEMF